MKKIFSLSLIIILLFGPQFTYFTYGYFVVTDPANTAVSVKDTVESTTQTGLSFKKALTQKGALEKIGARLGNQVLKRSLHSMTNWALTGFKGPDGESTNQPFYVQNEDSLLKNIEDQQLAKTIQGLSESCAQGECPNAKNIARTLVKQTINNKKNQQFTLDKVTPEWKKFTEGKFSEGGGWKTFEAMFNNPKNNAFGDFLTTSAELSFKKTVETGKFQTQLAQNDGFLSIRKCVQYEEGKSPTSELDIKGLTSGKNKQGATTANEIPESIDLPVNTGFDPYSTGNGIPNYNPTQNPTFTIDPNQTGAPSVSGDTVFGGIKNTSTLDYFDDTYALPGFTVDNCLRYEVTTPGTIAKEQLAKVLGSTIDKQIADSSTGNALLNSIVDLSATFINQGLEKLKTKATQKQKDQKIYAGGLENTIVLGTENGTSEKNSWNTEELEILQLHDGINTTKLHQTLLTQKKDTETEIQKINELFDLIDEEVDNIKKLDMCLPGPDFGWETRLDEQFRKGTSKIEKKDSEESAIFLSDLEEVVEVSKTYVQRLMKLGNFLTWDNLPEVGGEGKSGENKGDKDSFDLPIQDFNKEMNWASNGWGNFASMAIINKRIQRGSSTSIKNSYKPILVKRESALGVINTIERYIQKTNQNPEQILELKKLYLENKSSFGAEETIGEINQLIQEIKLDRKKSFDQTNPTSLISLCIEERKGLSDRVIGEDLGGVLGCIWQGHANSSFDSPEWYDVAVPLIGVIDGLSGGFGVDTQGVGKSEFDSKFVPIYGPSNADGKRYTYTYNGNTNPDVKIRCNALYRAPLKTYRGEL